VLAVVAWLTDPAHWAGSDRSEEHTSELQSHSDLVCRLLLEKKNNQLLPRRIHRRELTRTRPDPFPPRAAVVDIFVPCVLEILERPIEIRCRCFFFKARATPKFHPFSPPPPFPT